MKLVEVGLILATGALIAIIEYAPYIKTQKSIDKAKSKKES